MKDLHIAGGVDEGYGKVADAFRRNFRERGEIGAACAVYRDGRKVVDLWGGYRDARERALWEEDTLSFWASSTKGMAAVAVLVAESQGLFDLDEPVATYWPEFAQNGKENITVRHLLNHQSGLAALDRRIDFATVADTDALAAVLAAQRPWWEPGKYHGYHNVTFGWCESMLIKKVDPRNRTIGRFFVGEVADPLDIEFYIGLPDTVPYQRIATGHMQALRMALNMHKMGGRMLLNMLNPHSLLGRSIRDLPIPKSGNVADSRVRDYLRIEVPAGNGIGQVRAVARVYGSLATGGRELGIRPATLRTLEEAPVAPSGGFRDVVVHFEEARSLGFIKPMPGQWFGTAAGCAFGHHGGGGSGGFADPDAGIGFAYAPNHMMPWHLKFRGDPRKDALIDALYEILGELLR
ncbi:serine hydrolase domain-containing protein [Dethiobacter alkaliphilus]|uniref:serine hydrolase domain-containing protein n=1 Tax=Dethiobacter alkaliphilus TaxID=427926 RepID=UPI002225F583|nr:beta-lactamase family protein [Dethiobacter alkaliphilus]MCW3489479.1 beta-lactamase family protein [Dethiobacter alkaliphilus]